MRTYDGGCHCKKVRYRVTTDLASVLECNCSHCAIKGLLLNFVPAEAFTLLSGENELTDYQFNKKMIRHLFCKTCGVESFATGEKDGMPMRAVNVRCLDEIDLTTLTRTPFNGKAW